MKILFVAEVFYPENFLINDLAPELVKRGYEVEVLTASRRIRMGLCIRATATSPIPRRFGKG